MDDVIAGFQRGLNSDTPGGVTYSEWRDHAAGLLGGRISCATLAGDLTGQVCVEVESTTLLAVVDLVPNASLETDLPLRVREAVIQRQR